MQRKKSQGVISADSSTESLWRELTDQIIESRESCWSSTMTLNAYFPKGCGQSEVKIGLNLDSIPNLFI